MAVVFMVSCSHKKDVGKLIIGQWSFDKFEWSEESGYNENQQLNFNNTNKGFTLEFFNNEKLSTVQMRNGRIIKSRSTSYKILPDNEHIVIENDTSEVLEINDNYLKLFHPKRPIAVFRRNK
jgi:hypothetical protein